MAESPHIPTSVEEVEGWVRYGWERSAMKLSDVRRILAEWLALHDLGHMVEPITLVSTELLTNARSAALPGQAITLGIGRIGASWITLVVGNPGEHAVDTDSPFPPPEQLGGRGLALASAHSERIDTLVVDGSTHLRAWFHAGADPGGLA